MPRPLIILMYHYVRHLSASQYPGIKGLEATLFREQVTYLARHHNFVTPDQLIAALDGERNALPENGVLLTFDDGYRDHYEVAMPIMQEAGAVGIFFVPSRCIERRQVLDVNKIHFLLASVADPEVIAAAVDTAIEETRWNRSDLRSVAEYRAEFAVPNRFDPAVVIYVKRMLQHVLPSDFRAIILNQLFARWVSEDEVAFADELYLSEADLKIMIAAGMLIGSHGSQHIWMNTCDSETQASEIDESLVLLDRLGVPRNKWTFCYPYGGYNAETLALLEARSCKAAVTTKFDIAHPGRESRLLLPRLDTNDMPKSAAADLNAWSLRQLEEARHDEPISGGQ